MNIVIIGMLLSDSVRSWTLTFLPQVFKERKWLGHISYAQGRMEYRVPTVTPKAPLPPSYQVR